MLVIIMLRSNANVMSIFRINFAAAVSIIMLRINEIIVCLIARFVRQVNSLCFILDQKSNVIIASANIPRILRNSYGNVINGEELCWIVPKIIPMIKSSRMLGIFSLCEIIEEMIPIRIIIPMYIKNVNVVSMENLLVEYYINLLLERNWRKN